MRNPKLIDKFTRGLPSDARRLLDGLLAIADQTKISLYLVGGPLRDLLLERPSLDVDIAVEGDAMALARDLAEAVGGRAVTHPTFHTATVRADRFHLDLITARSETYARPGALPTVKPASIREDLLRRDFTINAIGLGFNGPQRGDILDPAGGLHDLDARHICALHERSFQDDATRILRAFRYAHRLRFAIQPATRLWLTRDISYLGAISGARLHHEFSRILAEDVPEEALRSLDNYGALAAIHPALRFDPPMAGAYARLRRLRPIAARNAYWPVFAWHLSRADATAVCRRLALTKAQRAALEAMPALQDLEPALTESGSRREAPQVRLGAGRGGTTPRTPLKRSALVELLSPFRLPALWAFAALTDNPTVRDRVLDYLTKARHERPNLTGDDLIALGVPEGPAVGDILRRLRNVRLDGEVASREDEERLVRRRFAGDRSKTTPLPAHPEVSKE